MSKNSLLIGTSSLGKINEFIFYINYFKIFKNHRLINLSFFNLKTFPKEDGSTFEINAKKKSFFFFNKTKMATLSDDSGFIINSSKNFPGVKTARFAKEKGGIKQAVDYIFKEKSGLSKIPTTFYCSLSFKDSLSDIEVSGSIGGNLVRAPRGINGFGFDPHFIPEGSDQTFSEMDSLSKLLKSHRFFAFKELSKKII